MHQLEERDGGEHVMARCDDSRCREPPLEPDRQIHECDEERQEDRDDRSALELASNAGTHGFSADDLHVVVAELCPEYPLDGNGYALRALRLRRDRPRVLSPHGELAVCPELLDLGSANTSLVEGGANRPDVGRLRELKLHQCSAGKLDAEVEGLDRERSKPQNDEGECDRRHHLPPADEVVVRVVKNSNHQMLRLVWTSRERSSQIM